MNDQLEADVRDIFALRAAAVPADAAHRVCSMDFHPRAGRVSPRLKVGSLAGLAAATGTVVSVVVLGGAQPAFAGWTAAPAAATSSPSASASSACQAQLVGQSPSGASVGGSWTPAATDVRGPYTVVIYEDGSARATCFNGPSFTVVSTHTSSDGGAQQSQSSSVRTTPGSGGGGPNSVQGGSYVGNGNDGIQLMTVAHLNLTAGSGGSYTLVEGQTTPDVTGVTLLRTDGSDVVATTAGSTFVAWWPGSEDVTSGTVTTPSGQTSQSLTLTHNFPNDHGAPTPISGTCTSVPSASQSSSMTVRCGGATTGSGSAAS
jgi:hypothetical protein